jgi:hypothetical protein
MPILNENEARSGANVVGHVFGGPRPETDSSKAVATGSATDVTVTEGQVYRIVSTVNVYFAFQTTVENTVDSVTADTGSLLIAEVPEIYRAPKGRTVLSLLGTEAGTVYVNRMEL